ncbi:hypothetical protein N7540_012552 [Penicillium herquei]|nr:hypothetical protein N7540_012552 [Penicillium herquei]
MERELNMYASWPQGLAILLQAGYKPEHNSLRAAIKCQCVESFKLFHSTGLCSVNRDDLAASAECLMLSQVIDCLVSERKHIQTLAETYLPSKQLARLALKPGSLLGGYQAFHACGMLRARDIDVKCIMHYPWLMYDTFGEDIELAEVLWNVGFRDVDEAGDDGLTTLMRRSKGGRNLNPLKFYNWLVRKGADLHFESPSGIPALHYLARSIGRSLLKDAEVVQENIRDPEIIQLLETILLDPIQDRDYTCACAVGGHCAASIYAYEVCHGVAVLNMGIIKAISRTEIQDILQIFEPHPAAFIRSLTFEALGIPHTCNHSFSSVHLEETLDLEEIQEIQDEWKDSIGLLEELLDEFIADIDSSDMPFSQFIQELWTKRIENALVTTPSSDEICQMREIGVVLEEIQ